MAFPRVHRSRDKPVLDRNSAGRAQQGSCDREIGIIDRLPRFALLRHPKPLSRMPIHVVLGDLFAQVGDGVMESRRLPWGYSY
jgi:hypothetical protein